MVAKAKVEWKGVEMCILPTIISVIFPKSLDRRFREACAARRWKDG